MRRRIVPFLFFTAAGIAQTYGIHSIATGGVPAARIAPGIYATSGARSAAAIWKEAGADEALRQAVDRATYSLEGSGLGTWHGKNPAQQLTFEFNQREARLSHPNGSVSFHLTGYGYGDHMQKPPSAELTGAGNRVEYRRGDLTEWYVNRAQGLEQGFTLARRPGADHEREPLAIVLGVTGELVPEQRADDGAVLFESSAGVVLRYAGLTAVDARGRMLPSRMEVRDHEATPCR